MKRSVENIGKRSQPTKSPKIRTFNQATKDFLTKAKPRLKASTHARYRFICERHLSPYFGDMKLNKLNDRVVNDFIQGKLKNGGLSKSKNSGLIGSSLIGNSELSGKSTLNPLSPKTVNDMMRLFKQIVETHHKLDFTIEKPSQGQTEITVFTKEEYKKLKAYLLIGIDNNKLGIITALLTGIRLGELCALKWADIDLDNAIIRIDKTMQRVRVADDAIKNTNPKPKKKTKIIIDTPKSTASIRTIPISSDLLKTLKSFQSHNDTYLLTNNRKYIEPRIYQRHFKSHLQACNIKDNKFHTLRHTFATRAISRQMDTKSLSAILGHTDVSFTMKRYVHPDLEHKRLQIEKVSDDFFGK